MQTYSIDKLADWQGFISNAVQRFEKGEKSSSPEIWLELWPDEIDPPQCSKCGLTSSRIHDWEEGTSVINCRILASGSFCHLVFIITGREQYESKKFGWSAFKNAAPTQFVI